MPTPRKYQTFAALCTALNRPTWMIRDLQKRFELPVLPPGTSYSPAYHAFLRTLVHLRVFNISYEMLTRAWQLEKSILRLLHADATGSPTWFLDACGLKGRRRQRLLLSNFDVGGGAVQLGLDFSATVPELFSSHEMGEDVHLALKKYRVLQRAIHKALSAERFTIQSALNHLRPLTQASRPRLPRRRPRRKVQPEPMTPAG